MDEGDRVAARRQRQVDRLRAFLPEKVADAQWTYERNREVRRARAAGLSWTRIARRQGVSIERVRVLAEHADRYDSRYALSPADAYLATEAIADMLPLPERVRALQRRRQLAALRRAAYRPILAFIAATVTMRTAT